MRRSSVRSRLYKRLAISLAATWLFCCVLAVIIGHREYRQAFESRVANLAQLMLTFAATQKDIDYSSPGADIPAALGDIGDYIVIISRNGKALYSSAPLPQAEAEKLSAKETRRQGFLSDTLYGLVAHADGKRWALTHYTDAKTGTRVTLGVDIRKPIGTALEVAGISALTFCVTTGLIAILMVYAIRHGLRPLDLFASEVGRRGQDNLTPIELENTPDELRQVAAALNGFMKRLDNALKRERDFVGNAAHELRTPLAAIRAQLEATEVETLPQAAAERYGHMLKATERAGHMISQLLDLSRSQSLEPERRDGGEVNLSALAETVIAELAPKAVENDVEIGLEAPECCLSRTDPDLLAIALRNLLENAVKYCGRPGRVEVLIETANGPGSGCRVRISDNGPGLAGAGLGNAAAKFERLGRTDGSGAGLGLSIVDEITRHLGIALSAEEPGPLGGLSVSLRLP